MPNLGAMRQVVTIERRSTIQDAAGEPELRWLLVFKGRAELARATGREVEAAQQRQGRVPTTFKLRFLSGVLPGMRLLHAEKVFDIKSAIDPDGRRRELVITADELVEEPVT